MFTIPQVEDIYSNAPKLEINKWTHVAVTYHEKKEVTFYLNGNLVDTRLVTESQQANKTLRIGNTKKSSDIKNTSTETILKQPNILFIFTDDQKKNSTNSLGNKEIITPHIDALTKDAFVFNNGYCFGGNFGAVCIPSRNMLMTGKTFFRFEEDIREREAKGLETRAIHFANGDWENIAKSMNAAGYETFYREKSGKHNLPEIQKDFNHYEDIDMIPALKSGRPGKKIVDDALFFFNIRDKIKPFFMYMGFPCPHDPRWALKEFRDLYDQSKLTVPSNFQPLHKWDIGDMTVRDEALEVWPRTKEAIQRHIFDYYSIMSSMDYDIGRLVEGLKAAGLDENTIIVYTSDQGLALGEHGLMGKQNIYEGTMRVPFFIKGAGIDKGTSDALVYVHDIFPTLCDLANTSIPKELDGKSLYPIIKGEEQNVRDNLVLAYKNTQRSVRNDRWKLIHFPEIGKSMLFDLQSDPDEISNLIDDSKLENIKKELFALLEIERKKAGDKIDLFPKQLKPANFKYPLNKIKTPYEAGGLAPDDPTYIN